MLIKIIKTDNKLKFDEVTSELVAPSHLIDVATCRSGY